MLQLWKGLAQFKAKAISYTRSKAIKSKVQEGLTPDTTLVFQDSYQFQGSYDPNVTADNPVSHSTAHTVEDFNNLYVLAWLQDISNKEVIQAYSSLLPTASDTSGNTSTGEVIVKEVSFKLYPNPADEVLTVNFSTNKVGQSIEIIDMQGRVVVSTIVNSASTQEFILSDLSSGMYILKVGEESELFNVR